MKKPTFSKIILITLLLFQSFVSFSQNVISYVYENQSYAALNIFSSENNYAGNKLQKEHIDKKNASILADATTNPVIKYAQLPYAGQVVICPDNGKELPKLFLCGGNDSRLIETGITDAQSIIWERFISGGSCTTVSNGDCANESAASSCWIQVATGKDYLANSAGQFRVKIVDKTATPYIYYFNVFQNTLIPTAVSKSDIISYGTGTCRIDGKITVGGFGSGYEYSFTTTGTPGLWQDSNIFNTNVAGNYTAFIRIKAVVGSCEFKVINIAIKTSNFVVTTSIVSPKCSVEKGSIKVITNDIKQQYIYRIFSGSSTIPINTYGPTDVADYTFTGLNAGTYRIETAVVGTPCMVDIKNNVNVVGAPAALTFTAVISKTLTACDTGTITVTPKDGSKPYKYFVNIDGAGFVEVPTFSITVLKSGNYVIRVVDVNGCAAAADRTIVVPIVDKPEYSVVKTDGNCTSGEGEIKIIVANFKGYQVQYSINNGATYFPSGTFSNLIAENYLVKVQYRKVGVNSGNYCSDPPLAYTVGAGTALIASAGVAELSGCGPVGKELQGRVRITNPQGGNPFPAPNLYEYSFDGRITWGTLNEAYINPGGP